MANYSVKLVDHTDPSSLQTFKGGVKRLTQERFSEAFNGTSDSVTVSWGQGTQADNVVIHFVKDRDHSYIRATKWPNAKILPIAGGHTHTEGSLACTELYEEVGGKRQHVAELGVLAFHETLHNLFPFWTEDEMHNTGGLAAKKVGPHVEMTSRNKEMMRQGFSVKNPQWL